MSEIKKIVQEEILNYLKEQVPTIGTIGTSPDKKKMAIENINKQVRLLKYMKEVAKQIKMPVEFENMAKELKKANTTDFLSQFLNVKDDIPVKVDALLTNPLELIQIAVDEVINTALKNAKQKLSEKYDPNSADLPFLARDPKAKHDKKMKKKGKEQLPPLNLGKEGIKEAYYIEDVGEIDIPNVKITSFKPIKGFDASLAAFGEDGKCIGWATIESLGYKSIKDWAQATGYTPKDTQKE